MLSRIRSFVLASVIFSSSFFLLAFAPVKEAGKAARDSHLKSSSLFERIKNWGIFNTLAGKVTSHIHVPDAWKITEGSRDTLVAVVDTGLDANHQDLKANIWREKKTNNYGWNFVSDQANPGDDHGHGTHIAGIIGAINDPNNGVSGVAQKVSIMSVKYYADGAPGSVNLRNTVRAIKYAVQHGARIINYSGGGPEFSEAEYLAIKEAEANGVLFVAAAGNEKQNIDLRENGYYPASYGLPNIITVAATDIRNKLLASSDWGKKKVDVAAPGENIYSTLPNGRYGYMSGTSQATAFVTGLAALLLSKNPKLTPQEIREIIKSTVDSIPELQDKVASGGRVNAYAALMALQKTSRTPVSLTPAISLKETLLSSPSSR